jgi:hypothetical protein
MNSSVFPIGHYCGLRPGESPEAAQVHVIRVGWRQHRLSEDAFGIWVLAHGVAETGKGPWTADDILGRAGEAGLADAGTHLEDLVSRGTLAVVPDRIEEAATFALSHRLDALFVGLGNRPDRLDGHAVGIPGLGTAAILDPASYELWQWGSLPQTLWQSCQTRVKVATQMGTAPEPADVLLELLGDLRYLIVHGCVYLDVAAAASPAY